MKRTFCKTLEPLLFVLWVETCSFRRHKFGKKKKNCFANLGTLVRIESELAEPIGCLRVRSGPRAEWTGCFDRAVLAEPTAGRFDAR